MIPAFQSKPAKRPTYRQRFLAGEVKAKPRARINPIAKKRLGRHRKYAAWIKVAIKGQKCAFPHCQERFSIEPHHPSGRHGATFSRLSHAATFTTSGSTPAPMRHSKPAG